MSEPSMKPRHLSVVTAWGDDHGLIFVMTVMRSLHLSYRDLVVNRIGSIGRRRSRGCFPPGVDGTIGRRGTLGRGPCGIVGFGSVPADQIGADTERISVAG